MILPTHTPALFEKAVAQAAEALRAGQVVALPTETVYGLAANALDEEAVRRIFAIKGRPFHNPIIVHVASVEMARRVVAQWPEKAEKLARAFWPGPLTLVLPRAREIPDVVTAGGATLGVRWPSHPFMQAVIGACGFPLAAPSANPSQAISPTSAAHVQKTLGNKLSLIIDGGHAQVGIESTVLDLTAQPVRVLRPGMIRGQSLEAVLQERVLSEEADAREVLRSPGQLPKHYAPRARLILRTWRDEPDLKVQVSQLDCPIAKIHVIAHSRIPHPGEFRQVTVIPHDAEAFARAIYAELHRADEWGAELIVVEAPPDTPEWQAIADRLKRASS